MPVEAHCPNPSCARVHTVKSKYAGMRGRCPACGYWMYVPTVGVEPSTNAPRPEGLEAAAAAAAPTKSGRSRATKVQPLSLDDVDINAPAPEAPPAAPRKRRPWHHDDEPAGEVVEEAVDQEVVDDEVVDDEPAEEARKPFSKLPIFLIILAILSLAAVAAAPFLPGPSAQATGWFENNLRDKPVGIPEDKALFVSAAPGPIILILLLALLMGLATRTWDFLPLALLYIAGFLVAGLAFFAAYALQDDLSIMASIDKRVALAKERMANETPPQQGEYAASMGWQLPTACGGVAAAALFLILAALFMHQRWWARAVAVLVLLLPAALVVVWNFRKELGVEALSPI